MTKEPPASQAQGLMGNPELSNILKNSLFSQVNVSIGTAGVSREGQIRNTYSNCDKDVDEPWKVFNLLLSGVKDYKKAIAGTGPDSV